MKRKRKTRKEKIAESLQRKEKEAAINKKLDKKEEFIIQASVFLFFVLLASATNLARTTIVELSTIFITSLIILLLTSAICYFMGKDILFFWGIIQVNLIWIFILCISISAMLIFINYIPFSKDYTAVKVRIERWETTKPKRQRRYPIAKVKYNGHSSTLPFSNYDLSQVVDVDSLTMEVRKGNLGYGYVRQYFLHWK